MKYSIIRKPGIGFSPTRSKLNASNKYRVDLMRELYTEAVKGN